MELLKCEGIGKIYGKGLNQVTALDGIDLSVEEGRVFSNCGGFRFRKINTASYPWRCGQTNFWKRNDRWDGSICLESETGSHFPPPEVGLVYQFYNLIPTLTVRKNILMPLLLDKKSVTRIF